jgi:hypothetical protein
VPVGGADFAVLFAEIHGVEEAEDFIHAAAQVVVVHGDVLQDAFLVDDE